MLPKVWIAKLLSHLPKTNFIYTLKYQTLSAKNVSWPTLYTFQSVTKKTAFRFVSICIVTSTLWFQFISTEAFCFGWSDDSLRVGPHLSSFCLFHTLTIASWQLEAGHVDPYYFVLQLVHHSVTMVDHTLRQSPAGLASFCQRWFKPRFKPV